MSTFTYRPWGRPDWLIEKTNQTSWVALTCLGTEKRSVVSATYLSTYCDRLFAVKISDPLPSIDDRELAAYEANRTRLLENSQCPCEIYEEELKSSVDTMESIVSDAIAKSSNIILDITSFPKRWFFPMARLLFESDDVKNLMVVYTKGEKHAATLSENPEVLRVLPGFLSLDERSEHEFAFVGVGFHTHSMLMMFGEDKAKSLQMLFPFPPGPPGIRRNWKFAQQVERIVQKDETLPDRLDPIRYVPLEATDVGQVFDALDMITNGGRKTSVMAPYGPKTFSLGMCLFALAAEEAGRPEIPVFYSQPQRYAVDYTSAAAFVDGRLDSWAYAVKFNGKNLYKL